MPPMPRLVDASLSMAAAYFICYAIEMTEIFFFEYTLQNQSFPASDYYSINHACVADLCGDRFAGFYLAHCHGFARQAFKKAVCHSRRNVLAERAADYRRCPLRPHSSMALLHDASGIPCFVGLYIFWTARKSTQVELKARVNNQRKHLIIGAILVGCIVAEDFYNILIVPMSLAPSWLQLYLSERNFSENVFACYFAILLIIYSYHVLSIRMQEAPRKRTSAILIDTSKSRCPSIATPTSSPTVRPKLCVWSSLGKSNQEIADELFLAVGTDQDPHPQHPGQNRTQNRTTLILHFWKR